MLSYRTEHVLLDTNREHLQVIIQELSVYHSAPHHSIPKPIRKKYLSQQSLLEPHFHT